MPMTTDKPWYGSVSDTMGGTMYFLPNDVIMHHTRSGELQLSDKYGRVIKYFRWASEDSLEDIAREFGGQA